MNKIASLLIQLTALIATLVLVFALGGATYFEMTGGRAHLLPGAASVMFGLMLLLQQVLPRQWTGARFLSLGAALGLLVLGALEIRGVVRGGIAGSLLLGVFSASLLQRGSVGAG